MCNAFGIVNYEGPNVNVKGMEDYRPVSAFSFLGRYLLHQMVITEWAFFQTTTHFSFPPLPICHYDDERLISLTLVLLYVFSHP